MFLEHLTYRMTLSYRGTAYDGWQSQPAGKTVQDVIEKELRGLYRDSALRVNGCSRTDAGVHAVGQVAAYRAAPSPFVPDSQLQDALNRRLPSDIRVRSFEVCESRFRPKDDAVAKTYTYVISRGPANCFLADLSAHEPDCVRDELMETAVKKFEGTHDFSAFTTAAERPADCTRTLFSARLDRFGDYLCMTFTGDRFLYRMVRRMAGVLMQVGCGMRGAEWIDDLLAGRTDAAEIRTAPACGLYLMQVHYGAIPEDAAPGALPFLLLG